MGNTPLFVKHRNWLPILLLFVASRALIAILGYVGHRVFGASQGIADAFCQWDCNWYMTLVKNGYDLEPHGHLAQDAANWAFFPLFPLLTRGLGDLLSIDYMYAAYLISNAAFLAALFVMYEYCKRWFDEETSLFCVALLAFSPYSFYFSVPYTEALFILLALLVFLFSTTNRWLLAGLAAAMLSATRTVGVMIIFPMLIIMAGNIGLRNLISFRAGTEKAFLALLLVPLGLFLFMLFLYHHVGDALAFKNVQMAWRREIGSPLHVLFSGFGSWSRLTYYAVVSALGILLSIYLVYRKRLAEGAWLAIGTLIPLSTSLIAMPRYIFAIFPIYIAIALITENHLNARKTIIAVSAVLLGALSVVWTNNIPLLT